MAVPDKARDNVDHRNAVHCNTALLHSRRYNIGYSDIAAVVSAEHLAAASAAEVLKELRVFGDSPLAAALSDSLAEDFAGDQEFAFEEVLQAENSAAALRSV